MVFNIVPNCMSIIFLFLFLFYKILYIVVFFGSVVWRFQMPRTLRNSFSTVVITTPHYGCRTWVQEFESLTAVKTYNNVIEENVKFGEKKVIDIG